MRNHSLSHVAVGLALVAAVGLTALPTAAAPTVAQGAPLQATPTSTSVLPPPPATPTLVPPAPTPSAVLVCPQIASRVPAAAINSALANPMRVSGYNRPVDAGKPIGPMNPPRIYLSIHAYSKPYHPLFNSVEFKAGCP